jgi:uncharacterized lipoprotein YajG
MWGGRRLRGGLLAASASLWLAGCALTDATLAEPRRNQVQNSSRRGENRDIVLVHPFATRRNERRCGMKKNGYNMDTASVFCASSPTIMLPDILARQLSQAGFNVHHDPRAAGPSTIVLTGVVDMLFVEPKHNFFTVTMETDIGLTLTAKTASGLSAQRTFYVKGEEATFFASEEDMLRSLESALRQLSLSVVGAVANLADRFPAGSVPERPAPPAVTAAPETAP